MALPVSKLSEAVQQFDMNTLHTFYTVIIR